MTKVIGLRCPVAAVASLLGMAAAGAAMAADISFTEAQAARGQATFGNSCGGCHGEELIDSFRHYPNALAFHGFISAEMPMDDPGGLPAQAYMDIMAYLMHGAGLPAGDEELRPNQRAALQAIIPAEMN